MYPCFDVDGLSTDQLLREWKWMISGTFELLAVNAYGDLFLKDSLGAVHCLDVTAGKIIEIAISDAEFRRAADEAGNMERWFLLQKTERANQLGFYPGKGQCLGGKIPWVFQESGDFAQNLYVAELYEYVSFMGDLHRQISEVPDGGKVQLKIQPALGQNKTASD